MFAMDCCSPSPSTGVRSWIHGEPGDRLADEEVAFDYDQSGEEAEWTCQSVKHMAIHLEEGGLVKAGE
ncbi:MAG: hypothetical protein VYC57_00010 [Verrucomicrobiota bacterium]|nr:hypothetical protein [Verrucomicrobiota bacterium]